MNRVMWIWLPNWPLQRLLAARPEVIGRRVVLYELHSRGGLQVVAGGEECGIKPGMPLAEAAALAEVPCRERPPCRSEKGSITRTSRNATEGVPYNSSSLAPRPSPLAPHPSPLLLPHDPLADREALAELAVWCERFSPAVALEAAERPDGLALDVTGLAPLFGGEAALAERVVHEFYERRLSAKVAIADTLGAAWAVAHFQGRRARGEVGVQPLGCRSRLKPELQRASASIVPPGETIRALAPLSVAALRLPEETITLLAAVGVATIGQLAALPRSALSARFGPELLVHLDRATGDARELLLPHRAVPPIAAEWSFETSIDSMEAIEQVLEELICRASAVLAKRDEGVMGLVGRITCADSQRIALAVGLFRPSASPKHLWELLKLKLETIRLAAPVSSLAVEITSTAALSHEQQELFAPDRSREAPRHLSALVERLSSRLGREAVVRPVLMPDAQPEFASVDWPLVGVQALACCRERRAPAGRRRSGVGNRASAHSRSLKAKLQPGVRPIWLAESPLPLSVISVVPAGPPAQFHFDGIDYRVARTWGPERIETGWWRATAGDWGLGTVPAVSLSKGGSIDGTLARSVPQSPVPSPQPPVPSPSARRDYYRIETTSGRRFWLFRRLTDARWFLHGEFG